MRSKSALDQVRASPAEIAAALDAFAASAKVLSSDHPRMIDLYENKWVGVYNGKVEVVADSLEEAAREIKEKALPIGETIIRRIDRNEKTLIL